MKQKDNRHSRHFKNRKAKTNEQIVSLLEGWTGEIMGKGRDVQRNGVLLLTNERLAFVKKGWFGEVFETIPIAAITSIETRAVLSFREFTFHTSHDQLRFKTFENSSQFQEFHNQLELLRKPKPATVPSSVLKTDIEDAPLAKLQKLAELKNAGHLTEDEFATAKAKIIPLI